MVGANIHMVLNIHEKSGKNILRVCMEEFRAIMDRLDLVDLPLARGRWTCQKSR